MDRVRRQRVDRDPEGARRSRHRLLRNARRSGPLGRGRDESGAPATLALARRPAAGRAASVGYGKERSLCSLIASLLIFAAGAIFSFGRGLEQILSGGGSSGGERCWLLYAVLGYALQTRPQAKRKGLRVVAFSRQSSEPTTKTVLYKDSAAVIGVLVAFVGVAIHQLTGDPIADNIASASC